MRLALLVSLATMVSAVAPCATAAPANPADLKTLAVGDAAPDQFHFPYLYDGETQRVSLAYGVVATPQAFLFDGQRKLRYVGRIDDSDVRTVSSHDLRNALDALLGGKPVPVEKTRTFVDFLGRTYASRSAK